MAEAREIMGEENYFGPEDIRKAFGFRPELYPPIPFSSERLSAAKEAGMCLLLRVDMSPDGTPMTLREMHWIEKRVSKRGGIFRNAASVVESSETPKLGWALVGKPTSSRDARTIFFVQTDGLVNSVRENPRLLAAVSSQGYDSAFKKFEEERDSPPPMENVEKRLVRLNAIRLLRPTMAEVVFDVLLRFHKSGRHFLEPQL
jgi:hypothetical protein